MNDDSNLLTASEISIVRAARELLIAIGEKPSIRTIDAVIKAGNGKRGMRWATISAALKVLPGNSGGNAAATVGQQFDEEPATAGQQPGNSPTCDASVIADLSRVVIDSAQGEDTNPLPPSPSPPEVVAEAPAPALFAVPDLPAKPIVKNSVAAQDPNTDFGAFEADVAAMVAVEQANHPRKKPAETVIRQRLALLWRKHGDDAFARGLEVGVSSGHGVNYGRAVMERFDPATEGHRFDPRPEPLDASSALPTLTELIAAGKVQPINNAAVIAERPAWFNQQLAAMA